MDISQVIELINGVGFPIVASGALFWLNVRVIAKVDAAMKENTKAIIELHNSIKGRQP